MKNWKMASLLLVCLLIALQLGSAEAASTPPRHIVIIVFENKEYSSIIGSSSAPYINSLANNYALATQYYAQRHPSLPNYIEWVAGSNMKITDDKETYVLSGEFLGRQLSEAGYSNYLFAESLPSSETSQRPCTYPSSGKYVKRHNPYAFWDWVQGVNGNSNHCSLVKPYSSFNPSQLAGVTWIIPNLCSDMHDCGISTGDNWIKANAPNILKNMHNNDFLVVTFDEGSTATYGGGHVVTIFAGPGSKKHFKDATFYNHDSLLRTIENIFHLSCIRSACKATAMSNMLY